MMAKRTIQYLFAAALIAFPASAGHAEQKQGAGKPQLTSDADFGAEFADYATIPTASPRAAHAVDVTTLSPAVEPAMSGTALGSGVASYYADKFNGRRTANGERFSNSEMTAAHRSLPFGSKVRVTNPRTGASVVVRINDRGPFHGGRTIDLSRAAASELGLVARGSGTVELTLLD